VIYNVPAASARTEMQLRLKSISRIEES